MFSMQKIAMLALTLAVSMVAVPQVVSAQDATTSPASGSGGGRGGRGMGRGGAMYTAALGIADLSADQKEKITALQKDQTEKNKAAYEKMQASGGQPTDEERKAMRERMTAQQKEGREKIEAILNDEQKKKFEEAMKAMPQGRFGGNRATSATAETKIEPKADAAKSESK